MQGWFLYDLPICFICKFQWYKPDKQPTLESLPVVQLTDTSKSFRLWEILYETNFSTCSFQQPQNILTKNFLNHKTFQIHQNVASYQRSWNWNIFLHERKGDWRVFVITNREYCQSTGELAKWQSQNQWWILLVPDRGQWGELYINGRKNKIEQPFWIYIYIFVRLYIYIYME